MFPRKIDERELVVGTVLLSDFVRSSSSTSTFVAARSPSQKTCTPCILDAVECMLLIEPSYFDSMTIFRAPDPSSVLEVELRDCVVHLARPIA